MENKTTNFATGTFLILITSLTEMPSFVKYPILVIGVISLIIDIRKYHKNRDSKALSKQDQ